MSEAQKLRENFERKLKELQDSCPHKESERMPYMWAPGHFGNDVEVCKRCGKTLKQYDTMMPLIISKSKLEVTPRG